MSMAVSRLAAVPSALSIRVAATRLELPFNLFHRLRRWLLRFRRSAPAGDWGHAFTSPARPSLGRAPICRVWCGACCRACARRTGFRLWLASACGAGGVQYRWPFENLRAGASPSIWEGLWFQPAARATLGVPRALSASPASRALVRGLAFPRGFCPSLLFVARSAGFNALNLGLLRRKAPVFR